MSTFRAVVVGVALAFARCASAPQLVMADRPTLVLRSTRLIALPGQAITLTAEVVGPAAGWACPRVVWTYPDGTESSTESDCEPGEPAPEMRWTRSGSLAAPGRYTFEVRLEKPKGHVIARQSIELIAAGGE